MFCVYSIVVLLLCRILEKGKASAESETELRETMLRWLEDGMDSPYLLSFIIDIYQKELENSTSSADTLKKAQEVDRDLIPVKINKKLQPLIIYLFSILTVM